MLDNNNQLPKSTQIFFTIVVVGQARSTSAIVIRNQRSRINAVRTEEALTQVIEIEKQMGLILCQTIQRLFMSLTYWRMYSQYPSA
jgi:hypothetical protein